MLSETLYLTWSRERAVTRPVVVFRLTFSRHSLRGEKWMATDRKWRECGLLVITYMSDGLPWPTFREITRREAEAIIRRERRRRSRFCWTDDDAIEVERRRG